MMMICYNQSLKSILNLIRSYKNGKLNQQRVAQMTEADDKNKKKMSPVNGRADKVNRKINRC